ncbi:response regulator [Chelatococcus sambhunathii]|uniref:Response regulator n=1 Tax=Chelatococcus sambhunathii TaxID=363953 RepID=A0ABU1DHX1_9HYPH|nr:response regulator [Chelatococcus sambhunathii]MDR4307689.1 response regulator [Chelatococcus sambhunathii]
MPELSRLQGRRILFAEDDYFIVTNMVSYFRGEGAEIAGPAARLQAALQIAKTEPLDGAVLDVDLRGESSLPIAQALLQRRIPFVFVTGYDAGMLPQPFTEAPSCQKPTRPELVADKLLSIMPRT